MANNTESIVKEFFGDLDTGEHSITLEQYQHNNKPRLFAVINSQGKCIATMYQEAAANMAERIGGSFMPDEEYKPVTRSNCSSCNESFLNRQLKQGECKDCRIKGSIESARISLSTTKENTMSTRQSTNPATPKENTMSTPQEEVAILANAFPNIFTNHPINNQEEVPMSITNTIAELESAPRTYVLICARFNPAKANGCNSRAEITDKAVYDQKKAELKARAGLCKKCALTTTFTTRPGTEAAITDLPRNLDGTPKRSNAYGGVCIHCNLFVNTGEGYLGERVNGKWTVSHKACDNR